MTVRTAMALVLLIQSLSLSAVAAAAITVGEKFPAISIDNIGECVLAGESEVFKPWRSASMLGKVQVFEYVAARAGIDAVHQPFYDRLAAAGISTPQIAITKLVNSDDAMWGTSKLVAGEIKKNKRQTPGTVLVVDAEGQGLKQWQLEEKNAALAIVDADGTVQFFKQGPLTAAEIDSAIALVQQLLP